jgi:hypothetical protein
LQTFCNPPNLFLRFQKVPFFFTVYCPFQKARVGIFCIILDRNKMKSCGFHLWKEEIKMHGMYIIDFSTMFTKVFLVSFPEKTSKISL